MEEQERKVFKAQMSLLKPSPACARSLDEIAREVTDACLQCWGEWASCGNHVARSYRDSRLISIGGGADEVMLGIIFKVMGILPKKKRG